MVKARTQFWASQTVLLLLGVIMLMLYRYDIAPFSRDAACHLYESQTVFRGTSLFTHTTTNYPPLSPFIGAGAMALGKLFGLPTFLSPRFASMIVILLAAVLLYRIVLTATLNSWCAFLAAMVLLSFNFLFRLGAMNLEPKILVLLFLSLSVRAAQRRNWTLAAFCATDAALCWQPAVIVMIGIGATAFAWPAHRGRIALQFLSGICIASLPLIVYLSIYGGWSDSFYLVLVSPFAFRRSNQYNFSSFSPERWFLVLGLIGFALFAVWSFRGGKRRWLHPRLGGLPLLSVLALTISAYDFQAPPDLVPILPLISVWVSFLFFAGFVRVKAVLKQTRLPVRTSLMAATSGVLFLLAYYGFHDAFFYRLNCTLQQQLAAAKQIRALARDGHLIVLNALEVYDLLEEQSPWRYVLFEEATDPPVQHFEPNGCASIVSQLQQLNPTVVVLAEPYIESKCYAGVVQYVQGHYRQKELSNELWIPWIVYEIKTPAQISKQLDFRTMRPMVRRENKNAVAKFNGIVW